MKVLMIVTCPEIGGTETHVLYLTRALRKHGIKVGVATGGGPFVRYFAGQRITLHKVYRLGQVPSKSATQIQSIVKKYGYNIVHVHDTESFRMLPFQRRQCPNIPLVMTVHGTYISSNNVQRAARFANRVITVSPAVRDWTIRSGVARSKVIWIPNGIDTHEFSPAKDAVKYRRMLSLPEHAKIALYVGRFQSDKWEIAQKCIRAGERIARRDPRFVLVLVGFGNYWNTLFHQAQQVNKRLKRSVVFVRLPTPYIARFYRSSTMVIGTGRVALEAMACGKPVITAGRAGYEGIVTNRNLSRMVTNNFGDHGAMRRVTVPRLTKDMQILLSNPAMAKSLGDSGRSAIIKQFSIQRTDELTRNVYRKTLS